MSKKIVYWTGFLEPDKEAVSKEVFELRRHFDGSFVFGMSKYYLMKHSFKERYFGVNRCFYPILKLLAGGIEERFELNHIFSHINEWFFIKMLHRRPVIFTTIGEKCGLPLEHYKHIDVIVAETSFDYDHLRQYGFDDNKLRLIRPGVDSKKFFYKNAPISGKFRILFASTPPEPKDIEVKGIKVLLTLAKSMPSVEIVIAVRPWASAPFIKKMVQASGLSNVLLQTNIQDMNELYGSIHATIAPFLMSTKSAPLSILESLMAGKPVILSNHIEVMNELSSEHCAVVFDPLAEGSVLRAVKELIDNYVYFQQRSRPCADKYYSLDRFFKQYEDLYDEVLQGNRG